MSKTSADLYPMRVNPLDFKKGDVVKKIITDKIVTPYTGVVSSVVPSTNKVEVQWPHSMGMEDPWDLIKVNPFVTPPVVNKDKAYKTYQNSEDFQKHVEKMRHYNVLDDFLSEKIVPLVQRVSSLYNEHKSKKEAYITIVSEDEDNKRFASEILDKIYDDSLSFKRESSFLHEGEQKKANIVLSGNSNEGFWLDYSFGNHKANTYYESVQDAVNSFRKIEGILSSLDNNEENVNIVAKMASKK